MLQPEKVLQGVLVVGINRNPLAALGGGTYRIQTNCDFSLKMSPDGRENRWNDSSERVADDVKMKWGRRVNRGDEYHTKYAPGEMPPIGELPLPTWPNTSWRDILHDAFAGRVIDSPQHPVFLGLEGRV